MLAECGPNEVPKWVIYLQRVRASTNIQVQPWLVPWVLLSPIDSPHASQAWTTGQQAGPAPPAPPAPPTGLRDSLPGVVREAPCAALNAYASFPKLT